MAASIITSFTGIVTEVGYEGEQTVTGENFTDGGVPTLYINSEVIPINSYYNSYIKFNMPVGLEAGYHSLRVLNGDNE